MDKSKALNLLFNDSIYNINDFHIYNICKFVNAYIYI